MNTNAAPNAARLARMAGVPLPTLRSGDFSFAVWTDGDAWGHLDVANNRVTRFDAATGMHRVIWPA